MFPNQSKNKIRNIFRMRHAFLSGLNQIVLNVSDGCHVVIYLIKEVQRRRPNFIAYEELTVDRYCTKVLFGDHLKKSRVYLSIRGVFLLRN